jgi:hypothetical protein
MSSKYLSLAATAIVFAAACAPESEPPAAQSPAEPAPAQAPATPPAASASTSSNPPAVIVAERGGFIPEGVEYDNANRRFLTGSLAEGSVFEIHSDGRMTSAVTDPELVSSVGIEVDEPRDRLLVTNSDSAVFQGGTQGQAKLGVYSLTSGERIAMVDLGATLGSIPADAAFFANDVAVADSGEIFVTDTRMNVLYRVDNDYQATLLHRFAPTEGLALNGIVYHEGEGEGGYLLVLDLGAGAVYKVPVANPAGTTQVTLPEPISGGDGAVWMADGRLAIVSNNANRVVALASDDNWASARIAAVAAYEGQATTAAAVGSDVYVVKPHFADQDPPSIERVTFR